MSVGMITKLKYLDKNFRWIMVTGGAGYVGSILVQELLRDGFAVLCVDNLRYNGESLLNVWSHPAFYFKKISINNYQEIDKLFDSADFHAVIHLAALVSDLACRLEPDLARKTNVDASIYLLEKAMEARVPRFIFSSSCSNYGRMDDSVKFVDEGTSVAPVSEYGKLKAEFEDTLINRIKKRENFCPTSLRFATIYGISPRMRFDLTINEFTKELVLGRKLRIFGENFWRPYCHVRDIVRATILSLKAPEEQIAYQIFNVGDTTQNYTKKMLIADLLQEVPDAHLEFIQEEDDPRDYRVSFSKIKDKLGFQTLITIPEGICEVIDCIKNGIFRDPDQQKYYNTPYRPKTS